MLHAGDDAGFAVRHDDIGHQLSPHAFLDDRFEIVTPGGCSTSKAVGGVSSFCEGTNSGVAGIRAPAQADAATGTTTHFAFVPRTDIIDVATGFKFVLIAGRSVGYLGIIYPLVVTGLAQVLFHDKGNGQLIEANGKIIGSRIIGQGFSGPGYFQSRPSAVPAPRCA